MIYRLYIVNISRISMEVETIYRQEISLDKKNQEISIKIANILTIYRWRPINRQYRGKIDPRWKKWLKNQQYINKKITNFSMDIFVVVNPSSDNPNHVHLGRMVQMTPVFFESCWNDQMTYPRAQIKFGRWSNGW